MSLRILLALFLAITSGQAAAMNILCSFHILQQIDAMARVSYEIIPGRADIQPAQLELPSRMHGGWSRNLLLKEGSSVLGAQFHSFSGASFARLRFRMGENPVAVLVSENDPRAAYVYTNEEVGRIHWRLIPTSPPEDLLKAQRNLAESIRTPYAFDRISYAETLGIHISTVDEFNERKHSLWDGEKHYVEVAPSSLYERAIVPRMWTTRQQYEAIRALSQLDSAIARETVTRIGPTSEEMIPHPSKEIRQARDKYLHVLCPKVDRGEVKDRLFRRVDHSGVAFLYEVFCPLSIEGKDAGIISTFQLSGGYFIPDFLEGIPLDDPAGDGAVAEAVMLMKLGASHREQLVRTAFETVDAKRD